MKFLVKENELKLKLNVDSLRIKKNSIHIYNKYNESFLKIFLNLNELKKNRIKKYELFYFFLFRNFILTLCFLDSYIRTFNLNIKKNILIYTYKYKENRLKYNNRENKINFQFLIFMFKLFRILFFNSILKKNILNKQEDEISNKFQTNKYFIYYKFIKKKKNYWKSLQYLMI